MLWIKNSIDKLINNLRIRDLNSVYKILKEKGPCCPNCNQNLIESNELQNKQKEKIAFNQIQQILQSS